MNGNQGDDRRQRSDRQPEQPSQQQPIRGQRGQPTPQPGAQPTPQPGQQPSQPGQTQPGPGPGQPHGQPGGGPVSGKGAPGRQSPTGQPQRGQPQQGQPMAGSPHQAGGGTGGTADPGGQSQGLAPGAGGQAPTGGMPQGPSPQAPSQAGVAGGPRPQTMRRPQLRPTSVEDLIQTDVVTATRDDTIDSVVSRMADANVGSAVVVADDSPVAVLTDRKIALNLPQMEDPSGATVDDLASEGDLVTGTLQMTVFEALQQLSEADVRRLPIVDEEEDTLEGIVTLDDLVVLLTTELDNAGAIIQAQSPRL